MFLGWSTQPKRKRNPKMREFTCKIPGFGPTPILTAVTHQDMSLRLCDINGATILELVVDIRTGQWNLSIRDCLINHAENIQDMIEYNRKFIEEHLHA